MVLSPKEGNMINSTPGLKKAGMLTIRIPKMANPLRESTKSILLDWDKGASVFIVCRFGVHAASAKGYAASATILKPYRCARCVISVALVA